uniref:CCA tRNA nucleotidyltransferase 1 n=2 Tax=Hirondellea gigas TaxID=1518452 RepID=A0A6A7G3C1_9CRUS
MLKRPVASLICTKLFSVRTTTAAVARTMKLSEDQMSLVMRPGVVTLSSLFEKHNHELRIAGGAVRDLLRGLNPHDLDFATTATPTEMKKMFEEEGIRMINETGEKHGTITARIEEENFECTTLRIDIRTDGRHAEVQFTKDWYLDANRRDLTFNSLFLGFDGTVYDYFNGKEHLDEHRVEFVGAPADRIQEDYLRILRYYRFYGRIAKEPDAHMQHVIDAITSNADGLTRISGERIWMELQKIAVGNFAGELLEKMLECKLGPYMGLPDDYAADNCVKVVERCRASLIDPLALQPMTVLAAGFTDVEKTFPFIARIRCSKKERELLVFVVQHRDEVMEATSVKVAQDLLADLVIDEKINLGLAMLRVSELLRYCGQAAQLTELEAWTLPPFPVKGGMIADKLDNKRMIKFVLKHLLELWKKSDFLLTADELIESVEAIQEKLRTKI